MSKRASINLIGFGFCSALAFFPLTAHADIQSQLDALAKRVNEQDHLIAQQQTEIRKQKRLIDALTKTEKEKEQAVTPAAEKKTSSKTETTQAYKPSVPAPQRMETATSKTPPTAPRTEEAARPQVDALANQGGVLTPRGVLTFENSMEYTNTTRNLFTFNGVELAQVVLVGAINDTSARHQVVQEAGRFRLGLTNRLEADVHVPFVYRNDALTTTNTTTGTSTRSSLEGADLGDIDMGLAYQMNNGENGYPFLIGNLRYKANNADGPYDVPYDASNVATRLPTGTGFQTVEASVTAIKVSDPAVLFANLGYVYDVPRDINRTFGTTRVGRVEPGDAVNALVGVAFAINNDISFSLGYKHSYVFSTLQRTTDTSSGTTTNNYSDSAQVGALTLGLTYAATPTTPINFNIESGVTNDAPDVHLILRVPFVLGKVF